MIDHLQNMDQKKPLHTMFSAIPHRYDLVNRVVSLGLDKRWRWQAAKECLVAQPKKVLDMGCGTGELMINIARLAENGVSLTGVDYCQPMLAIAAKKARLLAGDRQITFTCAEAVNLPFGDGYFDCIAISFAFRNLTYKNPLAQRHLAEILRVLAPGGRCVIAETTQPKSRFIRRIFHWYLRGIVYKLGELLSGKTGAYRYLAESAARFYTSEELEERLLEAGFRQVSFRPLLFGAIGICVAIK